MRKERLFSLDALRGLDMFYLTVVSGLLHQFFKATGASEGWVRFFVSHPWGGFTLYDLIMPLFIFMCGAAVPLALVRRLDDNGRPTAEFHRHVWLRFALLWFLGLVAQGNLQTWRWSGMQPYSNTLQTIAVGYVVAAYVLLVRNWIFRISVPAVCALAYGLIVHFGGDYTTWGNVTVPFEKWVLGLMLPENAYAIELLKEGGWYHYTWFLPSLMFPVIALAGAFSTLILKSAAPEWTKARRISAFGGAMLLGGLFLEYVCGVGCVKQIFTVSFTFQAIGWSILLLASLYILCDILRFRRGWSLILLFGQFALFAYVIREIFAGSLFNFTDRCFDGNAMKFWFPENWHGFVRELFVSVLLIVMMFIWRGYRSRGKEVA